jgi:cell division septum initiation protein DivIVA
MEPGVANSHLFVMRARSQAMSYFRRSDDVLQEAEDIRSPGSRWSELGGRLSRVFTVQETEGIDQAGLLDGEDREGDVLGEEPETGGHFPVGPLGYNRAAVDQYLAEVERELQELRTRQAPAMSITEEIERLGEQTSSILVVAHDQASETTRRAQEQATETTRRARELASETTRRAQEQADRCIADAASNAVAITEQAKQQLRELDSETDAVWQERQRLIEDVRGTASTLMALAEEAADRFPAEDKTSVEFSAPAIPAPVASLPMASVPVAVEDQPTVDFTPPFDE